MYRFESMCVEKTWLLCIQWVTGDPYQIRHISMYMYIHNYIYIIYMGTRMYAINQCTLTERNWALCRQLHKASLCYFPLYCSIESAVLYCSRKQVRLASCISSTIPSCPGLRASKTLEHLTSCHIVMSLDVMLVCISHISHMSHMSHSYIVISVILVIDSYSII